MNIRPPGPGFGQAASQEPPAPSGYGLQKRDVRVELTLVKGGGRTVLSRQRVPYPFHITRPFALDRAMPGLATIYLQSASGGLYRGDRLSLSVRSAPGAQAHITSQAATVVHRTHGEPAEIATAIRVEDDAFLAFTTDPYILFPGASFVSDTVVAISPGGRAIIVDGFATHDPEGLGRPFERLGTTLRIVDDAGNVIATDRGFISGVSFSEAGSPLGSYRAMGSVVVLGRMVEEIDIQALALDLDTLGCCVGASPLPNDGGLSIRCLATTGGDLSRGLNRLFFLCFKALTGNAPAPRRK